MSAAGVGPGGGSVGPGGGLLGPNASFQLTVVSIVLTLSVGVPTASLTQARATVGPGGGEVGPGGGLVGPAAGAPKLRQVENPISLALTIGAPTQPVQGFSLALKLPNPDQAPTDDSWARGAGNPIIEPTEAWEGTRVRGLRVIQSGGFYRGWYSGGDSPEAIGYVSCPDTDDSTDPLNWTKDPANPIIGDGAGGEAGGASLPSVLMRGGVYRLTYVNDAGQLVLTTSVDGRTGWTTPMSFTFTDEPRVFEIAAAPGGGWPTLGGSPFYDATTKKTIFGTTGMSKLLKVGSFDHVTGAKVLTTVGGPVATADQHDLPAVLCRSQDGRYVTMFCDHSSPSIYRRISTIPHDSTAWGIAVNIDSQFGGLAYTYPFLAQLGDEASDPVYAFLRTDSRTAGKWGIAKSLDGGDTWGALTTLVQGTDRAYGRCVKSSESRLDFLFSNGSDASDRASAYHFYYEGGAYFNSAGTPMGAPPFAFASMTKIYDGATTGIRAPADIRLIAGEIAAVFPVHTGALVGSGVKSADEDYIHCRAAVGSASWSVSTPAASIGALTLDFQEGSLAIDAKDLDHLILSRRPTSSLSSPFRMYDYRTFDGGATWPDQTQRTPPSADSVMYAWSVLDHAPECEDICLTGTFTTMNVFSNGILGFGVPTSEGLVSFGSRDIWVEGGLWRMLVTGVNASGRPLIYLAESDNGTAWTIRRGGSHYGTLQIAADGATAGPRVRIVDNIYNLWFHAAPGAGNLVTDVYHSTSTDLDSDAWTAPTLVLEHSGADFEVDQVADPDILVGTGAVEGVAFLFFDGQDNGAGTGAIGVALALSVGGITIDIPGQVTSTIHLPFDIGAVTSTIHLLFEIEGPPVTSTIRLPFEFRGALRSTIHLPFDILGPLTSTIRLPFDILSVPRVNEVQVIVSGGVVTSYILTFDGQPTSSILGTANAAAVQAALILLSNLAPGDVTVTGGPLNTTDLVITFGGAYAGLDVPQITVVATGVVDQPPIGTTTQNGGPTSTGGLPVRGIPRLWHPIMVFDKAGLYLGSISQFNVINPPVRYLRSRRVQQEGGMTFAVSRHSSDFGLIASDRLVRLQSLRGETPWWGTISPQADANGTEQVTCKDGFTLLRDGLAITIPPAGSEETSEEVNDGTPATAIYAKIMTLHNDLRASTGEVQWELDLQGTKPFRGDLTIDTDTLSALDMIIGRSRTEIAIDSRLDGNRLVPILRVRDRFDAGVGADIFDGPDGNVTAGVTVIIDPTPLVFSIRLNGLQTDLAKCLPEWAQWALLDVTPTVTVSVDPGEFRNRQVTDESVDWGLSHAAVNAQCNAILDWLWRLYRTYLMAVHDIEGRPNHTGWAYLGPPDTYEPHIAGKDSLSRRAWRTRLQLVEIDEDEPVSAVMLSDGHSQIDYREWLVVRYNRVAGVQSVITWAIESAHGLELIQWHVGAGSAWLYEVSGDRIISRSSIANTGAFVDPYNTLIYDPFKKVWRWLRRIINGPFALAYYVDPSDTSNTFVDLGVDGALSTTAGDGTSLIAKMYDFERFAIEDWDPRRDGIGARLARPTIFFGQPTTRPRWHIVSFDVGADASTSLTHGIASHTPGTVMDIEVDSNFGFPDPDLEPASFPFLATIDDGMDQEQILVLSMLGTTWHVIRGQGGTDAIIHEAGAPVKMFGAKAWPGFPFPYTWPEGQQWAEEEVGELSKQRIDINVHIAHFRDDQLTIDYGSMHAIDVETEGEPGRWVGTGRVIGWSTDPGYSPDADDPTPPGGETELVLEWTQ